MPIPLRRLLQGIKRELWQRRLPHGLITWRYLQPDVDPRLRLHRHFWWNSKQGWPRPIWLTVEGWFWLRWVFWYGWRASWRAVRRFGFEVRADQGISLTRQAWITLRLALGYCIPPRYVYFFQLYRTPGSALDYVYDHELSAYHTWRSAPLGLKSESLHCIQDKVALAERLKAVDVPVVTTHGVIAACSALSLDTALGDRSQAFCKMRSGKRGRGAFSVRRTDNGLVGRTFTGHELVTTTDTESAWSALLALDDVLIQPLLINHPDLAPMAQGGDVITVRYISQWQAGVLDCLCATLEIPACRDDSGRTRYEIIPIDSETGKIQPLSMERGLSRQAREQSERILGNAPPSRMIPHWSVLTAASRRAHATFPDVCAIAWDWVVMSEGPTLLEGNTGWGVVTPQIIRGGFLTMAARDRQ